MPEKNLTPRALDTHPTPRVLQIPFPKIPHLLNGASFFLTVGVGTAIGTGQVNDPATAWQLVTLSGVAMLCDALRAFARRRGGH